MSDSIYNDLLDNNTNKQTKETDEVLPDIPTLSGEFISLPAVDIYGNSIVEEKPKVITKSGNDNYFDALLAGYKKAIE